MRQNSFVEFWLYLSATTQSPPSGHGGNSLTNSLSLPEGTVTNRTLHASIKPALIESQRFWVHQDYREPCLILTLTYSDIDLALDRPGSGHATAPPYLSVSQPHPGGLSNAANCLPAAAGRSPRVTGTTGILVIVVHMQNERQLSETTRSAFLSVTTCWKYRTTAYDCGRTVTTTYTPCAYDILGTVVNVLYNLQLSCDGAIGGSNQERAAEKSRWPGVVLIKGVKMACPTSPSHGPALSGRQDDLVPCPYRPAAYKGQLPVSRAYTGQLLGSWAYTGQILGSRAYTGQILGSRAYTGQLLGSRAYTGQILGSRAYTGQILGSRAYTGQLLGSRAYTGQLLGPMAYTGQILGSRAYTGQLLGSRAYTGQLPGSRAYTGQLLGSRAYTGQLLGSRAYTGQLPGSRAYTGQLLGSRAYTGQLLGSSAYTGQLLGPMAHDEISPRPSLS
ncbi:hypothetical protein Bbelb_274920 [Branchiostoma belcheri]|nr:hypothetical protein Bbelb_274920 [Branchiostoma belcheri]